MLYIEYLVLSVKPTNIILKESKIKNFISEFIFFLCLFVFFIFCLFRSDAIQFHMLSNWLYFVTVDISR